MEHYCILIPHPRDEKVCWSKRKLKIIPRRLHCWLIEFFQLYRWGECKLPNKVHDVVDHLKSITAEMFNPTSHELCLLNPDSTVAAIVRAKDQEIKELKKRVAELEAGANKNLCVLAPIKSNATTTKEQRDRGTAWEKQGDNDGEEKKIKDEEEEYQEDEEMDEERKEEEKEKAEEDQQKEKKIEKRQDDKKGEKEDGKDEKGKEKEGEKEEEKKDGNDDEEWQVSCHYEVEMNKKLEAISQKLNFGQDVNFGKWDYEVVCTLSSIVNGV
ncbi:hypothetical protein CDL12_15244 [Handroanthus impetiginosus]|uniref:Ubiquitinyl hydrolase 1 n=1 Tax=Handroanthus impetiginosus TaxID=429701 RepID=A0A2G9H3S4_9LAMI|nr:hypothetical protein CDL12_15244 [Handroanthus impetiginosus]